MYAVIFRAKINQVDDSYYELAERMRELALSKYGCIEFISSTEGNSEMAISYWNSQKQIKAWKEDKEHIKAQSLGKKVWYKSYSVQIVEVIREYGDRK